MDLESFNPKRLALAIHYHVPIAVRNEKVYYNFEFGRWIDSLSTHFKEIIVFAFKEENPNIQYLVSAKNIKCKILGVKKHPLSTIINLKYYKTFLQKNADEFDIVCLRVPSFMAVYISLILKSKRQVFLIVGDMVGLNPISLNSIYQIKSLLYKLYWRLDRQVLTLLSRNRIVFTNDESTFLNYPKIKCQKKIFTSTIWDREIVQNRAITKIAEFRILWLGRISKEKGLETLIQAVVKLSQEMKIRVTIVGKGDKKYLNELRRLVPLNIKNDISFEGFVSNRRDIYSLMDNHDLFVNPSLSDAQPRTIWEAMARALPIICSNKTRAIFKEFKDNENVKFHAAGSVEDLSEKIRSAYSIDVRKRMSKESVKIAKSRTLEISAKIFAENL